MSELSAKEQYVRRITAALKPDERRLLHEIAALQIAEGWQDWPPRPPGGIRSHPRDIAERLNINHKRACAIFEKWTRRGWYNYGVCIDLGWLERSGLAAAKWTGGT